MSAPSQAASWRTGVRGLALAFALACAWAYAQPASLLLRDDRGVEVRLDDVPRRIVSLLPSITESLCALQACDRLVGTDRYSNWPPEVQRLPKLGGQEDAQIERIVALRPDVVLTPPSMRVADRLEALGLRVLVLDTKEHGDVRRTLALIARLLGRPGEDEILWQGIDAQIVASAARVPAAVRGRRVYFEVDASPYAAGPSSFIGQTLARLGMGNVVGPELGPFPRLNPEYVVRMRPDVVIAVAHHLTDMHSRPGWSDLDALRHGRSCGFDRETYDVLIRPGPRMGEAAGLLADCLVRIEGR